MTLLKAPLVLILAAAVHIAATPPNPPARPTERLLPQGLECYTRRAVTAGGPLLIKPLMWLLASIEVATILAAHSPGFALSDCLLRFLSCSASTPPDSVGRINPTFAIAWLCACAGAIIRLASYRALGRHFTFEVALQRDHTLVTSGPYGVVRHPSYIGSLLTLVGMDLAMFAPGSWARECAWPAATRSPWAAAAVYAAGLMQLAMVAGLCRRAPLEDEMLRKAFGKQWFDWAKRVPYRLVPGVY